MTGVCVYLHTWSHINGIPQLWGNDKSEWRMTDHVTRINRVELISKLVWTFSDKVTILVIQTSKKSMSIVWIRSYSCEWQSGEVSCWTGFGEELPVVRRTFFRSTVKKIAVQVSTFVYVKDHLRVAICELVEVNDDDVIFRTQRIDNMEHIFVRWSSLAYWSILQLACIAMARA